MSKKIFLLIILSILILQSCNDQDDFTFVFMTDIHVEDGRNAIAGFSQAIDKVNKLNPDFVITGGDLIADALGQKYSRADSLFNIYNSLSKKINAPVYNTIGNHDVFGLYEKSGVSPDDPMYGKTLYKKRIHGTTYYSFDMQGWHFIVLDAIGMTPDRHYIGHVDSNQIEWIKSDLAKIDKTTPIVISTHIAFVNTMHNATEKNADKAIIITNGPEVLSLFEDYNLKLVLQGHMHTIEEIIIKDVHFITCGAVCAHWWLGPHEGFKEGFGLFKVKGENFSWEYIDYGWEIE